MPSNLSYGKYTFYHITEQPIIPLLILKKLIPEHHPDQETVEVTLVDEMMYALDCTDSIIDDDLVDSFEFHDDAYILTDGIYNTNTSNICVWLEYLGGGSKYLKRG